MKRNEKGFTLLEVILLLFFSTIVIVPAYSHLAGMAKVKADVSKSHKKANRVYEIVEEVKLSDTEALLGSYEVRKDGLRAVALAEYDLDFDESREASARRGENLFEYRKLDIEIKVYSEGNLYKAFMINRVEWEAHGKNEDRGET